MPLRPDLYGIYDIISVDGQYVLAENAGRAQQMDAQPKAYIQGTPLTSVMDIGKLSDTITLTAPVLVGGGAAIDGRALIINRVASLLAPATATLPLLKSASIDVSENGCTTEITLMSDGSPIANSVFVPKPNVTGAGTPHDLLDPLKVGQSPTRTARFYDFRVSVAGCYYWVQNVKLDIEGEIGSHVFLAGRPGGASSSDPAVPTNPSANSPESAWGTQYTTLGIQEVRVSGTGKAAVSLNDLGVTYDSYSQYGFDGTNSVNYPFASGSGQVSEQLPGQTITSSLPFALEIYNSTAGQWQSILYNSNTSTNVVDLSKSIVTKASFSMSPGLMTVDFSFICYVRPGS